MARGKLRIYLGAAPGVGKTFAMLDEGWRRAQRGTDVVVAYVETHGRPKTTAQLRDLEVLPRRILEYRGSVFEEMDIDAVLTRRPTVALVDELAHTNVPGSRNAKRWSDVEELLAAGIDVITTVNVQHLESVNDVVEEITGVKQMETVPDEVVRAADQIELVDMDPEALRRRMAHGNIYPAEKVDAALGNYFRAGNLAALRELALLWTADRVDEALQDYREAHGIATPWETRERVVVAVTGAPSGEHLIRRAARIASRARGELLGVHVRPDDGLMEAPSALLEKHRQLLADLGGDYHEVIGSDVGEALLAFATSENATQVVLGASRRTRAAEIVRGSVINDVIRRAGPIDVHVISGPDDEQATGVLRRRTALPAVSRRRQLIGWLVAAVGIPLLTLVLDLFRDTLNLPAEMLLYLLLVVVVAVIGGAWPSVAAAVGASLAVNWFFTEPLNSFTIAEPANAVGLGVFLIVAAIVSVLVSQVARRSTEAVRARAEAEAIARTAGGLVDHPEPLPGLLDHIRTTFGLDVVALLVPEAEGEWGIEAFAGAPVPSTPEGHETVELSGGAELVLVGPGLRAADRRVLQAFVAQLDVAREHSRLRAAAADAEVSAQGDRLRTALLRAVSHDLRTPLSSIKASVTSLQQQDVAWSDEDRDEFLSAIDEETDRLDLLVGNLLDMSRLEAGAVEPMLHAVGVDEIVPRALASLGGDLGRGSTRVDVDVPESLPRIVADAALLERVVANLVANAIHFSGDGKGVIVQAGEVGDRVDLRIVDRGMGIRSDQRDQIFEPFQQLGDGGREGGVGLGLAVARGFVEAMGGEIAVDDTPGGGVTMVVSLRIAS
jgi:two-component system sensor histidine kinase KdpD